jgi:hypothetical protein
MNADIKNLDHLICFVPLIVILSVRLFNGLISRIKAVSPAIKGNNIIISPVFGSRPRTLKSLGLAVSCLNTSGFDNDFKASAISSGRAPIVLATIMIAANITIYLQI